MALARDFFDEWKVELKPLGPAHRAKLSHGSLHGWEEVAQDIVRIDPTTHLKIEQVCRSIRSFELEPVPGFWLGELREVGEQLSAVVLPKNIRAELEIAIEHVAQEQRVARIRLDISDDQLRWWPWEFLRLGGRVDRDGGEHLATSPFVSVARQSTAPSPNFDSRQGRPVRALVVWADPTHPSLPRAGGFKEIRAAERALTDAPLAGVEIHFLGGQRGGPPSAWPTPENIRTTLSGAQWDLVFFVCHAAEPGLFVESNTPTEYELLPAADLALWLKSAGVQIAMFDTCACPGIRTHVAAAVPIVVTTQFPVTLAGAATFWRAFFHALSDATPVDLCVMEGRQWLESMALHLPDWGTPVIYRGGPAFEKNGDESKKPERRIEMVRVEVGAPTTISVATRPRSSRSEMTSAMADQARRLISAVARSRPELQARFDQVCELLSAAAPEPWTPRAIAAFRNEDPWHLMLLGREAAASGSVMSDPIWWTALRSPPSLLIWPRCAQAAYYAVEIDDGESPEPRCWRTCDNALDLTTDGRLKPGGQAYWNATALSPAGGELACSRGGFWILERGALERLEQAEGSIRSSAEDLADQLVRTEVLIDFELYGEAIRRLSWLARQRPSGAAGFVVRRTLAITFKRMYEAMPVALASQAILAGAQNNLHMTMAYCAALGCLQVFRRGGCDTCGQCGLLAGVGSG